MNNKCIRKIFKEIRMEFHFFTNIEGIYFSNVYKSISDNPFYFFNRELIVQHVQFKYNFAKIMNMDSRRVIAIKNTNL